MFGVEFADTTGDSWVKIFSEEVFSHMGAMFWAISALLSELKVEKVVFDDM